MAKSVAEGFFADMNAGRTAEAFGRLAPDVKYEIIAPSPLGGKIIDRDGLEAVYATRAMPHLSDPLKTHVTGITAEGDRVAIEAESSTQTKNGKSYNNRYHFLFVVQDGVIVEGREYLDTVHFEEVFAQL